MPPSVMSHTFSQVPQAEIQRSSFDRSHGFKTTFNSGYLIPIFTDEVLPGDTFNLSATFFGRLATPIVPFMDNLFLDTFFFFVPNRLLWEHWQQFNGEQANPDDSTDYVVPQIVAGSGGFGPNSLEDYFGLPVGIPGISVCAFWHRAYNLIWNQWFRDQNLFDSVAVDIGDGPDSVSNYTLLKRGKRHDYFTSCLPWPQKGPGVSIPLSNSSIVPIADGWFPSAPDHTQSAFWSTNLRSTGAPGISAGFQSGGSFTSSVVDLSWPATTPANLSPAIDKASFASQFEVSAEAATINSLRQAIQLQRLYERDARGGTRYTEIVHSHFGVISPDARLQRPEYLGGSSQNISVHPVPQTSASASGVTPQGNLAAFGTVQAVKSGGFSKSFTEHGVILGLAMVRADLNYQQGLSRMWSRSTRFDFYWPALAHLGEQSVLNQEIYCQGTSADQDVFGYQERYAEYRYKPSLITGEFRSTFAQPLDMWHLAQDFTSLPTLGPDFMAENPPLARVLAVTTGPQLLLDCYFNLKCVRPMPVYSVPGLVDHF